MIELLKTQAFDTWFSRLKDDRAQARIAIRLRRLAQGNPGDVKAIGGGLSELRIDYGPGYRVYFTQRGNLIIVLLIGGNKKTQGKDIQVARVLADELKEP